NTEALDRDLERGLRMRLDSHIHVYDEHTLRQIAEIVPRVGMTHYVGIMDDEAIHLVDRLDEAGARSIPFYWLDVASSSVSLQENKGLFYRSHYGKHLGEVGRTVAQLPERVGCAKEIHVGGAEYPSRWAAT
ncbi:MAG: hypothetical protein J7M05_11600, partial [Anaerolineae bacterium]|nr:hypothetical protein [Anaerolineae bacterium]